MDDHIYFVVCLLTPRNKDALLTLGISIPVNLEQPELHYLQNQGNSSAATVDFNKYYDESSNAIFDSLHFCNLLPSLDPNLGILGSLTSSNIPYEKSPFNSWNIEPYFLHVLPLSTTNNDESSILIFGGIDPFSVAERKSFDFDHEDFVLGSTIFEYLIRSGVWKYYGTMIEPRCYHTCVLIGQHVYITGGYSLLKRKQGEMLAVSSTDMLCLHSRLWKRCADMITARAAHAAVSYKNFLYVFGGRSSQGNILSSVELYNPDEDLWLEISFLPRPAMGLSVVCAMDRMWLLGGIAETPSDSTTCLSSDVFSFTPSTKRWSVEQSLPRPRAYSACVTDGHSLWIIGGCTFSDSSKQDTLVSCSSIFQLSFSPALSKWKSIASLLHPRHALTAVLCDETIYVLGGIESGSNCTSNKVEVINIATKMSIEISKTPVSIAGSASVLVLHEIQDSLFHINIKSGKEHSQSSIGTDYGTPHHAINMDRENLIIQINGSSSSKEEDIAEGEALKCTSVKYEGSESKIEKSSCQNLIQSTESNDSVSETERGLEVKEGDIQKKYTSTIEKDAKKSYSASGIESCVPKSNSVTSMEKGVSKSYSDSIMNKDVPKMYSASRMERDDPKTYSSSCVEKDVPKSYSVTSMEKDVSKSYSISSKEKDVPESCRSSSMEKIIPKSYSASSLDKDVPKRYSASSMDKDAEKYCSTSSIEKDIKKSYTGSSIDKDVTGSNASKHVAVKRNGSELKIKNSDNIAVQREQLKDHVICRSSKDLEVKEKDSFDKRRNSKTHLQNIQDKSSSNLRYRASMETFLDPGTSIKQGNLVERKSSATRWLKYFDALSAKSFKDSSSSKESFESGRRMKESDSSSQQPVDAYFKVPPELKGNLIGQKDNFVSVCKPSARPARRSLLYVHSSLKSQLSFTESDISDIDKMYECGKSAKLRKDSFSAILTDSTRISVTQESLPSILVMGGEDTKGRAILSYSCNENNWGCSGYMPGCRCYHSVIVLEQCIYIIGGFDSQNSKEFGEITGKNTCYDFYKEMWLEKASMISPRALHATIIMKGEIYVLGGRDQSGNILASIEIYNQSQDEWREEEPVPYPVLGAAVTSVKSLVYLFGGITYEDENETISSRTVIYDPKHKSWSSGPNMPTPLAFSGVSTTADSIWLFGGLKFQDDDLVPTKDVLRLDLTNESWYKVAELSVPRHAAITVSLGTNVYIMGGYSPQADQDVTCEQLDMSRKKVFVLEPLPIAASGNAGAMIISLVDSSEG